MLPPFLPLPDPKTYRIPCNFLARCKSDIVITQPDCIHFAGLHVARDGLSERFEWKKSEGVQISPHEEQPWVCRFRESRWSFPTLKWMQSIKLKLRRAILMRLDLVRHTQALWRGILRLDVCSFPLEAFAYYLYCSDFGFHTISAHGGPGGEPWGSDKMFAERNWISIHGQAANGGLLFSANVWWRLIWAMNPRCMSYWWLQPSAMWCHVDKGLMTV